MCLGGFGPECVQKIRHLAAGWQFSRAHAVAKQRIFVPGSVESLMHYPLPIERSFYENV